MSTPSTPSVVKTEFVEVLTSSDLIPPHPPSLITDHSPSTEEFPPVLTESLILESESSTGHYPEATDLIQIYDDVFSSPSQYQNFTEVKLAPWRNTRDFKYFDILYKHHRYTSNTIKKLRQQAVDLLNEADVLTQQHLSERKELDYYLRTLPRSNYQRKLFQPIKINPSTSSSPSPIRQPVSSSSQIRPL